MLTFPRWRPCLLLAGLFAASPNISSAEAHSTALLPFASSEGLDRLGASKQRTDFARLSQQFEPQITAGHCGPATTTIILNTLRIYDDGFAKPEDKTMIPADIAARIPKRYNPFLKRYTQRLFFEGPTSTVKTLAQFTGQPKSKDKRPDPGFQLRQVHEVLRAHGVNSLLRVVPKRPDIEAIRRELADNLGRPDDYVVVNFHRKTLGQRGGGHFSPLAAYDQTSDSFLLLDVNPTKHPWVWVPTTKLVASMATFDTIENRGYLLVSEGKAASTQPVRD